MSTPYPEEFRRRAVDLVRESGESVSAVASGWGFQVLVCRGGWPRPGSTMVMHLSCPPRNIRN